MSEHIITGAASAYVSVMRGCDRYCSYCIVPFVRGRERSRSREEIIAEIRKLSEAGLREITLLGQNIAAYGLDRSMDRRIDSPFAELLADLGRIDGIHRIRFTSPHPAYFNTRLIEAVANLPKVCKNVHLPLQSGSDSILKKMNRHYTVSEYMSIINALREKVPLISFSTDIIVGFPGETEEDFEGTRKAMDEASFENAYIFKYSPRTKTAAAKFADDVPFEDKERRNRILLEDLSRRSEKINSSYVGRTVQVLVDGPSKRNIHRLSGRTDSNKMVVFEKSPEIRVGDLVDVKIMRASASTLFGDLTQ